MKIKVHKNRETKCTTENELKKTLHLDRKVILLCNDFLSSQGE